MKKLFSNLCKAIFLLVTIIPVTVLAAADDETDKVKVNDKILWQRFQADKLLKDEKDSRAFIGEARSLDGAIASALLAYATNMQDEISAVKNKMAPERSDSEVVSAIQAEIYHQVIVQKVSPNISVEGLRKAEKGEGDVPDLSYTVKILFDADHKNRDIWWYRKASENGVIKETVELKKKTATSEMILNKLRDSGFLVSYSVSWESTPTWQVTLIKK